MTTVRVNNVSFTYGSEATLNQLNFTIKKGECLVLCGISGCGKTTITRILNGLIPELFEGKLTGEINVMGSNTKKVPIYALAAKVGSVFQNPKTQFFTVDVLSELAFACENQGISPQKINKRIDEVAELFEINHLLERNMFELSGGEKQLVAFASAYMAQPQLLVLDEISSNLDFNAIEKIKRILQKVKNKGCTIVIAEHRLYYLTELADRYLLIAKGEINKTFSAAEFKALNPSQRTRLGLRVQRLDHLVPNLPVVKQQSPPDTLVLKDINLTYKKKKTPALNLNTMHFTSGDAIGILGHNGAGKTSLGKTITGLLPLQQGEISLNGKKLTTNDRINQSFLVMQDVNYQLFCETVEKELRLKIGKPELFDEVIANLNLRELLERHPLSLSGGEKQRVAIANAILSGKKVIVLDEPTSGLDYYHMTQVSDTIAYLRKLNIFVFIISHDLEFISLTCNQLLILHHGENKKDYDLTNFPHQRLIDLTQHLT